MTSLPLSAPRTGRLWLVLASPAVAMFVSTNLANAGNLLFNMLFSRWMGPELFADLATLLTLKLSLLALLNAVQMAASQVVSAEPDNAATERALVWLNRVVFVALGLALPVLVPAALSGALTSALGLGSGVSLAILLFGLPVTAPLCLARGVAIGRMDVRRLVLSSNIEMAVRLGGSIALWQAGFGLPGVVLALAASLVAGWIPVRGALGTQGRAVGRAVLHGATSHGATLRRIGALALPFAVLQAAQVLHLDGDVLVANLSLSRTETGLMAVLSLFQRIQFFACFGLAAVLLPSVAAAVTAGRSGLAEARPALFLFAGLSLPLMAVLSLFPGPVIMLLSGPAFAAAAPQLPWVGLAAVFFTFSYLGTTFLAATGDRRGIWLIAGFVPVQIGGYALAHHFGPGLDLATMVAIKLAAQGALAFLILLASLVRLMPARA